MIKNTIALRKAKLFARSKCRNNWLHRFVVVFQYENGIKERCQICGQEETFKIMNGQTSNLRYLSYHMRQALPMNHPLFKHEYPR